MNCNIPERMGDRIRLLREDKKMSQAELAEMFGIKRQTVSYWETDERTFNLDVLKKLAKHLGTTSDYILFGKPPENVTVSNELGLDGNAIKALQFAVETIQKHEQGDSQLDITLQYAKNTIDCANILLSQKHSLLNTPVKSFPYDEIDCGRAIDLIMSYIRCDCSESEWFDLSNQSTGSKEKGSIRGSDVLAAKLLSIQQELERLRKSKLKK